MVLEGRGAPLARTHALRALPPHLTRDGAARHDAAVLDAFGRLLILEQDQRHPLGPAWGDLNDGARTLHAREMNTDVERARDRLALARRQCQLPISKGGMGLASASRTRHLAYVAAWADFLNHDAHPLTHDARRHLVEGDNDATGNRREGWIGNPQAPIRA